jgi:hypothetical protein
LEEGAAGEGKEAQAFALKFVGEGADKEAGAFKAAGGDVVCEHGAGNVHRDEDVAGANDGGGGDFVALGTGERGDEEGEGEARRDGARGE